MSTGKSAYHSYLSHWRAIAGAGLFAMVGAFGEAIALIIVAAAAPKLGSSGAQEIALPFGSLGFSASVQAMFGVAAAMIAVATVSRGAAAWVAARAQASWMSARRR